jgi:hypothetical protein
MIADGQGAARRQCAARSPASAGQHQGAAQVERSGPLARSLFERISIEINQIDALIWHMPLKNL